MECICRGRDAPDGQKAELLGEETRVQATSFAYYSACLGQSRQTCRHASANIERRGLRVVRPNELCGFVPLVLPAASESLVENLASMF